MARILRHCRSMVARITRSKKTTKRTCFDTLPPELWQMIASYLPLSSAASLILTCRSALALIGTQCWVDLNLRSQSLERMRFLEFLDKSLPRYFLCQQCHIFHRRWRRECLNDGASGVYFFLRWECDLPTRFTLLAPYGADVTWSAIQLVMRAHRYGPQYGISIRSLHANYHAGMGWSRHSIPRIVDGRLLIRVRALYWIPRPLPPRDEVTCPWPQSTTGITCQHSSRGGWLFKLCLAAVTDLSSSTADEFEHDSELLHCLFCPTEYMVQIRQARHFREMAWPFPQIFRRRYVLSITRWIDIGDGRSILSKEWTALATRNIWRRLERFDYSGMQGIRSRFEAEKS